MKETPGSTRRASVLVSATARDWGSSALKVEADCKTVIGHRIKQSGMHWAVRGANAIISLRWSQLRGWWEELWEARSASQLDYLET